MRPADLPERLEHSIDASIPYLIGQGRTSEAFALLMTFPFLLGRLRSGGSRALFDDLSLILTQPAESSDHRAMQRQLDHVRAALQLCAAIIDADHDQLAAQLLGRLQPLATRRWQWWLVGMRARWQAFRLQGRGIVRLLAQARAWRHSVWLRPHTAAMGRPGQHLIRTLRPHTSVMTTIALAPDGRWMVSAAKDGTARVIDGETGIATTVFTGHQAVPGTGTHDGDARTPRPPTVVHTVAITPDGRSAITWGSDYRVRLWDLLTGREHRAFLHTGYIWQMAVAQTRTFVAIASANTGSEPPRCGIYDLATATQRFAFAPAPGVTTRAVALTADDRCAVSAHTDRVIRIWDIPTATCRMTLPVASTPHSLYLTPTGDRLIAASEIHIWAWDLPTGRLLRAIRCDALDWIKAIIGLVGSHHVLTISGDRLTTWSLATGTIFHSVRPINQLPPQAAVLSSDTRRLVVATERAVHVWDFWAIYRQRWLVRHIRSHLLRPLTTTRPPVLALALKYLLLGRSGQFTSTLIHAIAFAPNGQTMVVARGPVIEHWQVHPLARRRIIRAERIRALIHRWMRPGPRPRERWYKHIFPVRALSISADGKRVVSAADDSQVRIANLRFGSADGIYTGYPGKTHALACFADGTRLLVGGGHSVIQQDMARSSYPLQVIDWRTNTVLQEFAGHPGLVSAVVLIRDDRYAISSGRRDFQSRGDSPVQPLTIIRIWDLHTNTLVQELSGHPDVTVLAFAPRSQRLLSASANGTLVVWFFGEVRPPQPLTGHTDAVNGLVITPDERYAITISADQTIRVWDLDAYVCRTTLTLDTLNLSCALSPDGRTLVVGDRSGAVHWFALERSDGDLP